MIGHVESDVETSDELKFKTTLGAKYSFYRIPCPAIFPLYFHCIPNPTLLVIGIIIIQRLFSVSL
jgi:hypothetical protein